METEKEKKFSKEKLNEYWTKTKTAVGNVSKKIWIIVAILIVALAAGIAIYLNTRPYSILVTGANANEVSTVTTWLENRGMQDYRVQGGNTVLVPDRQAAALKAALLTEMYSEGSYDYSFYFDNVSMLSTESERNNALQIALQQKMESVISQMEGVSFAQVTITPGEDLKYVLDSGRVVDATASVFVQLSSNKPLDDKVADAIRGYVAGGVQGLKIESVALYDNYGNHYDSSSGTPGADADASLLKFQLEQQQANKIRTEIMTFAEPLFGTDNVKAAVNVTVEMKYTEITENEQYIPEYIDEEHRSAGLGIVGSRVYSVNGQYTDLEWAGGLVGADPNSDVPAYMEPGNTANAPDGEFELGGQVDYNNPTRETHTVNTAAYITDVHIAMSVNSRTAEDLNVEQLRQAVANAAGISPIATEDMTAAEYLASKVTIYVGPFYETQSPSGTGSWWPWGDIIPEWMVLAALAGLLLFIILLVVILVLRSRSKKKKLAAALAEEEAERAALEASALERQEAEAALAEAMGMPQTELVGADVMSLQTEKSMELRQDIRQFVEENPEVAAQLLKSWLRGGEEHG